MEVATFTEADCDVCTVIDTQPSYVIQTIRPNIISFRTFHIVMASIISPFRNSFRYLQRQAHESPVIFYSVVLGTIGPVLAFTVPPIRESFGYRPPEPIPITYPLPKRLRRPVQGYEDKE